MEYRSNRSKKNCSTVTSFHSTALPDQVQQLNAELWIEQSLNRLNNEVNTCFISCLSNKNTSQSASHTSTLSQVSVEAEVLQVIVKEMSATLGTDVVAIALPRPATASLSTQNLSDHLYSNLSSGLTFEIAYVAPFESRRANSSAITLPSGQLLRLGLGEIISIKDLQHLQNQDWQIAWAILDEQETLGWLITSASLPSTSGFPDLGETQVQLRLRLIRQVVQRCAIALKHARLLQQDCPQCHKLETRNQELTRSNQLKSEFLANTSHEIRTPLSSILGFTRLLQEQGYDPHNTRQKEYLNIILTSGKHLLALINDILDLSKVEADQLDLQWETVDVPQICQGVLALVKEKASDKGLQLRLDLDSGITTFVVDPLRLKQMLFNLLSNALKFTSRGTVGLQVKSAGVFLNFTVWDTGAGISKEQQKQLFQPYVQISNELVGRDEGTGLGLALTQKLAELHGGWIKVESELNQGSQFTIGLPLTPAVLSGKMPLTLHSPEPTALAALPVASNPPRSVPVPGFTRFSEPKIPYKAAPLAPTRAYHILLVEDNAANAKLIITYLCKLGYEVTWAIDGKEMWRALSISMPALILMDIHLPGVDGLTLTQQLREYEQYRLLPIVAQTAMAMIGDREACFEAGATDYISKPIDLEALANLIAKYSNYPTTTSHEGV